MATESCAEYRFRLRGRPNYRDKDMPRYDLNIAIFDTIRYIVPSLERNLRNWCSRLFKNKSDKTLCKLQLEHGGYWVGKVQIKHGGIWCDPCDTELKLTLWCYLHVLDSMASPCRRLAIYWGPLMWHQMTVLEILEITVLHCLSNGRHAGLCAFV